MSELDGFKYRARDAWRAVTKIAVREARLKEIKKEILNSNKLKTHFEANPRDAAVLRHDRALHTVKHQAHLKNVPEYIVPEALKKVALPSRKRFHNGKSAGERRLGGGMSQAKKKFEKRRKDPLKNMMGK